MKTTTYNVRSYARPTPITKLSTWAIFVHLYKRHEVNLLYTAIAVTLVLSVAVNLGVL